MVDLAAAMAPVLSDFPRRLELPANDGVQLTFGHNATPRIATGHVLGGFRYESEDAHRILQVRRTGFVFSLLPPYDRWDSFAAMFRPLWESYRDLWQPLRITRVALRYVNAFDLWTNDGLTAVKPSHYLTLIPGMPRADVLPLRSLHRYSIQVAWPQKDINALAVINTAMQGGPDGPVKGAARVVLDIDLFREKLDWDPKDDALFWEEIGRLRVRKNELFRACITERLEQKMEPTQ